MKDLWFKAKNYGWGWYPCSWEGWLVIALGITIFTLGLYVGETDDAPGATLMGAIIMILVFIFFGYWKGEKPRWRWGK